MFDSMNGLVAGLQGHNTVLLVRWYATRAQMTGRSPDPSQCARTANVLVIAGETSKAAADYLASEFRAAFERSARHSREIAFEHGCDRNTRRASLIEEPAEPAIVQTFRWLGLMAYIKGIDGSPWHDSQAVKRLKREPSAMSVSLIRAWEAGYDDAYDNERQLLMERRSILEQPRIYDARHIRVAVPRISDKRD
ncbi:MAG: hypothetical protein HC844_08485 [Tabrizicola sp.]|nr:hypothetical protein [Tabrizicola sp.]